MKKFQNRDKLGDLVDRTPKADPAWGATAVEHSAVILDPLRRGASRSSSGCPYDWEQGWQMAMSNLREATNVVNLAILKARALRDAGQPREAVELLLDAAQFGRDLTDDGPLVEEMIGTAMLYIFLDGARELAASEKADAESLADLEQGLAVLDGSFPKHAGCIRREQLELLMSLSGEGLGPAAGGSGVGFPTKLFQLNFIDRLREAQEQMAQACERPWAESLATAKRVDADLQKSWNPVTRMFKPGAQSTERYVRERLAQLRLLRAAIRYRRTGERLELADPFGTTLKSAASGEGLKLWSIGADGVDDGGRGEWGPKKGPDIVVEARR
jgi:hypothetical protein